MVSAINTNDFLSSVVITHFRFNVNADIVILLSIVLAGGEGFEPSDPVARVDGLASRCIKPSSANRPYSKLFKAPTRSRTLIINGFADRALAARDAGANISRQID